MLEIAYSNAFPSWKLAQPFRCGYGAMGRRNKYTAGKFKLAKTSEKRFGLLILRAKK